MSDRSPDRLTLDRTRAALAQYDAACRRFGDAPDYYAAQAALHRVVLAKQHVADAFAADTAGLNDPAVARRIMDCRSGQEFVRALVQREEVSR